eukprot:4356267-Ditylum_brightwellii.AAC.1
MKTMWKKIGYTDKGQVENNITSISISTSWQAMTTEVTAYDKTAISWRKVKMPAKILHYLTLRNR